MCINTSEGFFCFVLEIVFFFKVSRKSHYLYNVSDELAIYDVGICQTTLLIGVT